VALAIAVLPAPACRAADGAGFCSDCELHLGIGATYHFWATTGSPVVPVILDFDRARYEVGAFRIASGQNFFDHTFNGPVHLANPYWGFSASRRFALISQPHWRLLVGVGVSYKTERDTASASRWDFAEQLGVRIMPTSSVAIELLARHWSDAGIRLPNHGQDFATLTVAITPMSRFASMW